MFLNFKHRIADCCITSITVQ